jgi:hypothetical protein
MNSLKKPDFVERRDAAAHAKKAALEKFHKSAADPAFAELQTARIASAHTRRAAKKVREIEKAEEKAREAIRAEQAAAESANREVTLQAERKAGRDARYAASKSRSKR